MFRGKLLSFVVADLAVKRSRSMSNLAYFCRGPHSDRGSRILCMHTQHSYFN